MEGERVMVLRCGRLFDGRRMWVRDTQRHRPDECIVVVVRGERIAQVGWESEVGTDVATGAQVIDLSGYTVMPGLIDCHVHPLINENDYQMRHLCQSSAFKALRGLAVVQALLKCGWTTLRVAGDADVHFAALDLRRAIDEGIHLGPRMTGAGHYLSITGGGGDINTIAPEHAGCIIADGKIVDGPDEMRKAVREEIKYGSDWIKLLVTGAYMSMSNSSTDSPMHVHFSPQELHVAVEETRRLGKHVMAHAHSAEGIKQAIRAGVRSIEHGSFIDDEGIELMLQHGTWLVPTQFIGVYYSTMASSASAAPLSKMLQLQKETDEQSIACLRKAVAAGVKIACGSDFVGWDPALNVRELECLVTQLGMTPVEALHAATSSAAELLGWDKRVGSVACGLLADLIVVDGDPSLDIACLRQVRAVVLGGAVVHSTLPAMQPTTKTM